MQKNKSSKLFTAQFGISEEFNFEILNLKNLIKSSNYEASENQTKKISQIQLLNDTFNLNLFKEEQSNNTNELNSEFAEQYSKIFDELNLNTEICVTHSCDVLLKSFIDLLRKTASDLIKYFNFSPNIKDQSELEKNSSIISFTKTKVEKLFTLFYNLNTLYYCQKENEKDFAEILVLHNIKKAFSFVIEFYIKLDLLPQLHQKSKAAASQQQEETTKEKQKNIEKEEDFRDFNMQAQALPRDVNQIISLIEFYIKKFNYFADTIMSKIFSNFLHYLSEEFTTVENFAELRYDRKYKKADKMFKNSNEYIIKFFDYFKLFANEKDFFFNLNYGLCLFFDVINKKILSIKDFSVDDLVAISNFLKTNSTELKKGLEKIIDQKNPNTQFKLKYSKILDINQKYKKFEEIIFVLNSGLKDIKNLVVNSNKRLNIDPNELVGLIEAIFEQSDFRDDVKNIIFQHLRK